MNTLQNPNSHPRKALVEHIGKAPFTGEIVAENDKGYTLRTGAKDSPATEWFAKQCQHGTCVEV